MKKYEEIRNEAHNELLKSKSGAMWLGFVELNGLVNINEFAKRYLNRSGSWMHQRIHNYNVNGKSISFKAGDYDDISQAFRKVAEMMMNIAESIDKANN